MQHPLTCVCDREGVLNRLITYCSPFKIGAIGNRRRGLSVRDQVPISSHFHLRKQGNCNIIPVVSLILSGRLGADDNLDCLGTTSYPMNIYQPPVSTIKWAPSLIKQHFFRIAIKSVQDANIVSPPSESFQVSFSLYPKGYLNRSSVRDVYRSRNPHTLAVSIRAFKLTILNRENSSRPQVGNIRTPSRITCIVRCTIQQIKVLFPGQHAFRSRHRHLYTCAGRDELGHAHSHDIGQ